MAAPPRDSADSTPAPARGCPGLFVLCLVDRPSGSADTRPPAAAFVPNGACLELSPSQAVWFERAGLQPWGERRAAGGGVTGCGWDGGATPDGSEWKSAGLELGS